MVTLKEMNEYLIQYCYLECIFNGCNIAFLKLYNIVSSETTLNKTNQVFNFKAKEEVQLTLYKF